MILETMKIRLPFAIACAISALSWAGSALAISSAELYTAESYFYGRVEASIRYAPGAGVVGSFFLWKDGSEVSGTYWNELDFEKLDADCHLVTNAFFGNPGATHSQQATLSQDLCGEFHTYKYEWTPEYIAWFVDDVEIRRETGDTATAYAENATAGMQVRFNVWPGNASFGGVFDPNIVPVYQYVDWVEYSAYVDGAFQPEWRDDFDTATLDPRWLTGSWDSPKNLSTHSPLNVGIVDGQAVLALTADDAQGTEGAGASPAEDDSSGCSCRVAPAGGGAGVGMTLLFGCALVGARRRLRRGRIARDSSSSQPRGAAENT